jgi:hypothetical protein
MMASVSYETKRNNTQNDANNPTTTYNTLNTSVNVFPGANLPTFTVGYGLNTRKNPIELRVDTIAPSSNIDSTNVANDATNRFFLALNYDFHMVLRNSLTASVSIANKKDKTFYRRDQENLNVSTALTTFFTIPMQTTIALIVSHNATYAADQDTLTRRFLSTTQKQTFNYQTISFNARYRMMNEKLNLLATLAPSFGDFKRLLVQVGAEYQVRENQYLVGQLDLIRNAGKSSDVIASVVYRFMF